MKKWWIIIIALLVGIGAFWYFYKFVYLDENGCPKIHCHETSEVFCKMDLDGSNCKCWCQRRDTF